MDISILQWNIWAKESPQNILSLINSIKPDILCLQELTQNFEAINYENVPKFLASQLDYNLHFAVAHEWKDGTKRVQGNGIFSRFPIAKKKSSFIQKTNGSNSGYDQEGRILIVADIQIEKKTLSVATTHLSYTHEFQISEQKKIEEKKLLDTVTKYDQNFILTGDFNEPPNSYLVKQLLLRYKHAGPDFSEKTWTTKPFNYRGFREDQLNWRLDYAFTSRDIQIKKSQILKTTFSDHLPILITIDF